MDALLAIGSLLLTLLVPGAPPVPEPQLPPPIPVLTTFAYWDHHWIQWLPTHPRFEAIEVMTLDAPRPDGRRLWRVFFTERAGGKRQVYYFNDPQVAARWPAEAHARDIEAQLDGAPGKPRGLTLRFLDASNQPVEWTVSFGDQETLSAADEGMPPHTHAVESAFLMFYRGRRAWAPSAKLVMGGEDYSPRPGVALPGRSHLAAYTSGAHVATLTYGAARLTTTETGFSTDRPERSYQRVSASPSGRVYRSETFGLVAPSHIEIETSGSGELRTYRHQTAAHSLRIDFEPGLPGVTAALPSGAIRFAIALDGHERLLAGSIVPRRAEGALILPWEWSSPDWAAAHPMTSTLRPTAANGFSLRLERGRGAGR